MNMITLNQLRTCAAGLAAHEHTKYARRVAKLDPILGVCELMSADANDDDGLACAVDMMPVITYDRSRRMEAAGVKTRNEAALWWPLDQLGLCPDDPQVLVIATPYME